MLADFYGTRVCWLVFTTPGCAGWILLNEAVLAVFCGARVFWQVFTEPWCAGWFLRNLVLRNPKGVEIALYKKGWLYTKSKGGGNSVV